MTDAPDPIRQEVESFAEDTNQDPEAILEAVKREYEQTPDSFPEQKRWTYAYRNAQKDFVASNSMSGSGDAATIITIGHGPVMQWDDKNHPDYDESLPKDQRPKKDVLMANGVVRDDSDGSASLGVILLDETDEVDLGHAMGLFREPFNLLQGEFSFSEPNKASSEKHTILFSVGGTELTESDEDLSLEERKDWVHKFVDEVKISDIASNPEANRSLYDDRGAADFGVDIKRIPEAWIVDYAIFDNGNGVYTIVDDSLVDPESELQGTDLIGDSQQVAGLSSWTEGDMINYDNGATADFYGVVQRGRNEQIEMNVRGIDFIFGDRLDEEEADNQTGESF